MPARLIRADDLYPGAPYAYASVAPPGGLVFTAGACPIDEAGVVTDPGDYAAQAARAVANLVTALAAAGVGLADVLKTTVYVASADQRNLLEVWEVVHAAFDPHDPPSTLLGVTVLGYAGQLVEIEAVALARMLSGGAEVTASAGWGHADGRYPSAIRATWSSPTCMSSTPARPIPVPVGG